MRFLSLSYRLLGVPALVVAAACSSGSPVEDPAQEEDVAEAVPDGKADNYLSPTSMEYRLSGQGKLELDASWKDKTDAEKEARARLLLDFKFKAYAHYINVYVTNKEGEESNAKYGGFSGAVRKSSIDSLVETADSTKMAWTFLWDLEMGAPRDIMNKLQIQTKSTGEKVFMVKLPALDESSLLNGSYSKDFDPSTYTGAMEDLEVQIDPIKASFDAWPNYNALLEDGKLDVLVLVGGDYNAERYDLQAAEKIFAWLKQAGYKHDAASYKDLTLDSPPLIKTMMANGKPVSVEVTFYHPDIVEDAKLPDLKQKIIEAYQTKDVLIYDGHAGEDPSYSGVVYHYNPRHAISANDLAQMNLPSKYQIYLFNGCKTYSAYPDALYQSPTKTVANLDIISTVNFSWLTMQPFTTSGFITQLMAVKNGTHDPRTYLEILGEINKSSNWNVYYGVHGIDDNPHVNPYAEPASLCKSCTADTGCPGMGNKCIKLSTTKVCAAECTADDGCPEGYACKQIAAGGQITGMQCLPKTLQCQ
ncbi:MAG: hypothetical protein HY898_28950 [Deltaproteobacteria bacterium]|nr:hypothetical protein [Deltaproteobacteria bacterium]